MKTKHILTALALPAVFAACTAEDIVNEGAVALQERATVSGNFTVKVGEGVESRYAVAGSTSLKFNFETGDKFGAAIIDQYDASNPKKPELWDVIPSLAGNTPFTYNANTGEWKAPEDLPLGIGHYLFVYPYNRADVNRAAVSYELPAVQKLYTEEDGEIDLNAAIEAGNKSFYSTVLYEGDEELEITLKNLYAYPKFVINFDNGEKVTTVSKVVLAKKGGFEIKGGFNHEVVAALFADETTTGFYDEDLKATNWDLVQTADVLTTDEDYATIETSPYLVAELPLDAEVEKVTNNKVIEVRFMIPGVLMSDLEDFNDYEMYIYTDNGVYAVGEGEEEDFEDAITWKSTTKLSSKLKAFARGTANTITINKNYVVKAEDEKYIVTSIEDWNALVKEYGDEDKFVGDDAINVVVVGGSLVLDETAKMPTEAEFKVDALTIKGDVELCNVIADEVVVAEDATLTTCGTFTAAGIVNKGELNVAAVYNNKGKAQKYDGVEAINNYGILNVEEDAITEFYIINQRGAVLNNEGTLTMATIYAVAADDIVQTLEGNDGTINNTGTINMGYFNNLAPEYSKNKKLVNMPTINNEGKILTKGDVVNFGTVINKGTLSCKNQAGTFTNAVKEDEYVGTVLAVLDAKEDGLTYITENNGEVIVYAPFQEDVVIEKQNGTVSYTTNESSEAFYVATTGATSYVTSIYVSDDYTLTATNGWIALNVMDDATVTRKYDATKGYLAHVAALNVMNGTTVLGSDFNVNSIYVEEGAMVKVPVSKTLNVGSSVFNNKGEIEVAGNFAALSVSGTSTKAGVVTESGANAKIYWKENADEWNAAATKAEALKAAVEEYINDANVWNNCISRLEYKVTETDFERHIAAVKANEAIYRDTYAEALYYAKTYGTNVDSDDLTVAVKSVKDDNKEELIEELTNLNIALNDETLYEPEYNSDGTLKYSAKTNAYNKFQELVVKRNNDVDVSTLKNAVTYAASELTDAEIDAILAEAAPYAYIWEGCVLDQLANLWKDYDGMFSEKFYDYDANKANIATLKNFFVTCYNGTSELSKEVKGKMPAGVDLKFLNDMKYTDAQVQSCCGVAAAAATALTDGLN